MWRTAQRCRPGSICAKPGLSGRGVGLPSLRGGLQARILGSQALVSRTSRDVTRIARSSAAQDPESTNHAPLVPQQQNGALPAVPGDDSSTYKVPVQFVVPEYLTHWGQVLKVVGSLEELGSWKVEKAPSMQWNEGHTWTLDVQLPVGAVNFKIVMHDQPNSHVRWEQGDDRKVLIPETTTVTGAPVGQVGVTCDFNDVYNSRVEVRPDRAYLKQQLKAVEARVMAIQEKKRKLDQRMSVLTDGLKKYDATVALLQTGVQSAVDARRSSKEATQQQPQVQEPEQQQQQQQQQVVEAQQPSSNGNGVPPQPQQLPVPAPAAVFNPLGRKASIQVPIMDPAELPAFGNVAPAEESGESAAATSAAAEAEAESAAVASSSDAQQSDMPGDAAAVVPISNSSSSSSSSEISTSSVPDVTAIKASHVNETVLSATVDQLLAAAEDALARSSSTPAELLPALTLGSAGVDDSQLAEEYVEELLAAASALEQQADRRANLLLEAAKHRGDSDMAADIEQLAAAELPPIPTVEELAEAAAAAAAIDASLQEEDATISSSSSSSSSIEEAAADVVVAPAQQQQQQPGTAAAGTRPMERDGCITFSAESLAGEVDVQQLLAAVLNRVGVPLTGHVTISATYTPNTAAAAGEDTRAAGDALEAAAEASLDTNMDDMGAAAAPEGQQQQQEQEQALPVQQEQQKDVKPRLSPIDAIAAVLSRGSSMDSDDDDNDTGSSSNSRSSIASSNGRSLGFGNGAGSSSNGAKQPAHHVGRYARTAAAQAAVAAPSVHGAAGAEGRIGAAAPTVQASVRLDSQEVARQVEAKEAARRAAAERVAAALAQVEEMRRSVVAANSLLQQQLSGDMRSGRDETSRSTSTSSNSARASSSAEDSGRAYSKYRVAFKQPCQSPAAPAGNSPHPSSTNGTSVQQSPSNGTQPGAVSVPGAARGLPAIAATSVVPSAPVMAGGNEPRNAAGAQQPVNGEVQGEVREELSLLAALAAEVAKQARRRQQQ